MTTSLPTVSSVTSSSACIYSASKRPLHLFSEITFALHRKYSCTFSFLQLREHVSQSELPSISCFLSPALCNPNRLRTNGFWVRGTNNATHCHLSLSLSPGFLRNLVTVIALIDITSSFSKKETRWSSRENLPEAMFLRRLFSCTVVLWTPSALNPGINQRNGKLWLVWSYNDIYGTIFIIFLEFLRRKAEFLFRSWSHRLTLHFVFNSCSFIRESLKN